MDFKRPQNILGESECSEACCGGLMQATLSEPERSGGELCCVGKLQNMNPKMFCSLDFSLLTFFVTRQRKNRENLYNR
jgi:hypothetical protein